MHSHEYHQDSAIYLNLRKGVIFVTLPLVSNTNNCVYNYSLTTNSTNNSAINLNSTTKIVIIFFPDGITLKHHIPEGGWRKQGHAAVSIILS